ncbi:MAG TPA: hypothetical protein VIK78_14635 [Ruminiclostridium sp.]
MVKWICKIFGHELIKADEKDMFGMSYVWQPYYCKRCGERNDLDIW